MVPNWVRMGLGPAFAPMESVCPIVMKKIWKGLLDFFAREWFLFVMAAAILIIIYIHNCIR